VTLVIAELILRFPTTIAPQEFTAIELWR